MLSSIPKPIVIAGLLTLIAAGVFALRPGGPGQTETDAAKAAVARRDFDGAVATLETLLARHDTAEARLLAAQAARRGGRDDAAERHLAAYVQLGGDRDTAELERAIRRSQNGDLTGAGGVTKFAADNPALPHATAMLEALARGFMAARRPREAVATLDALLAREASPADRAEWLFWRGEMFMGMARGTEAAADLRAAIRLRDDHAGARLALVKMLSRDEPLEALPHLEWLDAHGHRGPAVRLELARCHRHLGDTAAAAAVIADLVAARPADPDVLTEAGAIELARGRPAAAEGHLTTALAAAPDRYETTALMARCLQELGRGPEAKQMLDTLRKIEADMDRKTNAPKEKP